MGIKMGSALDRTGSEWQIGYLRPFDAAALTSATESMRKVPACPVRFVRKAATLALGDISGVTRDWEGFHAPSTVRL